jgi:hypothetical protein
MEKSIQVNFNSKLIVTEFLPRINNHLINEDKSKYEFKPELHSDFIYHKELCLQVVTNGRQFILAHTDPFNVECEMFDTFDDLLVELQRYEVFKASDFKESNWKKLEDHYGISRTEYPKGTKVLEAHNDWHCFVTPKGEYLTDIDRSSYKCDTLQEIADVMTREFKYI